MHQDISQSNFNLFLEQAQEAAGMETVHLGVVKLERQFEKVLNHCFLTVDLSTTDIQCFHFRCYFYVACHINPCTINIEKVANIIAHFVMEI